MAPPPGNETNEVPLPSNLLLEAGLDWTSILPRALAQAQSSLLAHSPISMQLLSEPSYWRTHQPNAFFYFGGGAWLPGRTPIGPTDRLPPAGQCYVCSLCAYWPWRTIYGVEGGADERALRGLDGVKTRGGPYWQGGWEAKGESFQR